MVMSDKAELAEPVYEYKRPPKVGEYGWWIANEFTLEQGFNREFKEMWRGDGKPFGWRCDDAEFFAYDNMYLITVVTHD